MLEVEMKDPIVASSDLVRENRGLDSYSPIFYWIGWIAVAYLIIYVLAVYVGPAIFGTRPNYPFYYGRSLRDRRHLDENRLMGLVAKVLPAIEKKH